MNRKIGENTAAAIVREYLGVPIRRTDVPGAPARTADFAIELPSGATPFEVTRATDGAATAFWRAVNGQWTVGTARTWQLSATEGTDVRYLRKTVQEVLHLLEAQDVHEFDASDWWGSPAEAALPWAPLVRAGVRRAYSFESDGAGTVFIGIGTAFVTSPEVINEVVVEHLRKPDNAAKVGADGHLFIWVEPSASRAWTAMDKDLLPDIRPSIDPGPTIWVARQRGNGRHRPGRLWRFDGVWQSLS